MGQMVDGVWRSDDELLDQDPVAGPVSREIQSRLDRLREDMDLPLNRNNFRERLRRRLEEEGKS